MARTDRRPKAKNGLTIKQDRFVREYVKDGNGKQAALKAGYSGNCPAEIASENLTKLNVANEIARHRQRLAERLDISREKLVNDAAHDAEQASVVGDYSAANASRTFIAKAQGYLIERTLSVNVDLTAAHLEALKALSDRGVSRDVIEHQHDGVEQGNGDEVGDVAAHAAVALKHGDGDE